MSEPIRVRCIQAAAEAAFRRYYGDAYANEEYTILDEQEWEEVAEGALDAILGVLTQSAEEWEGQAWDYPSLRLIPRLLAVLEGET